MRLKVIYQEKEDIGWCVREVFERDEKLIDEYHIKAGSGLEECVRDTVERLHGCNELEFYLLEDEDGYFVGYFGKEGNVLTTFGIVKEYRNKEVSDGFWKVVKENMGGEIICGLYNRNTRAIEWLKKNGAIKISDVEDTKENESIQVFKILNRCQSQQVF